MKTTKTAAALVLFIGMVSMGQTAATLVWMAMTTVWAAMTAAVATTVAATEVTEP